MNSTIAVVVYNNGITYRYMLPKSKMTSLDVFQAFLPDYCDFKCFYEAANNKKWSDLPGLPNELRVKLNI